MTALAVERLPGRGGHVPAHGLQVGGTPIQPIDLPGVILAALASVGLGLVVGPEAPLLALGAGLGLLLIRAARADTPAQGQMLIAAAGSFAAISFLFDQPIIAAVLVIEATGLAKRQLPLVLLPGLAAAGIGSLVTIGMGKLTGLSTAAYALSALPLPAEARPTGRRSSRGRSRWRSSWRSARWRSSASRGPRSRASWAAFCSSRRRSD